MTHFDSFIRPPCGSCAWGSRRAIRGVTVALLAGLGVVGCGTETPIETTARPLAAFEAAAGDAQTGRVGEVLPISPEVRVSDAAGDGVAGAYVNFVVTAGGGSVSTPLVFTDEAGVASVPWTLGSRAGEDQRLLAAVVDPATGTSFGVELTASAEAGAPAAFEIQSGNDQVAEAGAPLPQPLVVRVTDVFDNPVPGVDVAWVVANGGGNVAASTTSTSSDGLASVVWTLGTLQGVAQVVTASVASLNPVTFNAEAALRSEWEILPVMPKAVRAPAAAARGNFVYVIGGTSNAGRTNSLQIFDVTTESWAFGAPAPMSADWSNAVFVGDLLHLVGGVTDGGGASYQHWIYDPAFDVWSAGADLPVRSAGAAIASDGSTLYVAGGRSGDPYSASMRVYDAVAGTWSVGPDLPGARATWAGDWMDGRLFAAGGEVSRNPRAELFAYDPVTDSWSVRERMVRPRMSHGAATIGEYFCVFGGRGVGTSVECYSPEADRWEKAASMPAINQELGAVALGGAVYVVGGREGDGAVRPYLWRFTLR